MMYRLTLILGILLTITLSGCGKYLYLETGPETISDNQEANFAAGYMARYLMPTEERRYLLERIGQKIEQQQTVPVGSTAAGFFGAMALGENPLSQSGLDTAWSITLALDVGLGVAKMFGPDGSVDNISSIYLPEEVGGKKIESESEASNIAREYTINRIREIAKIENRRLECLLNCGQGGPPAFRLVKNGFTGDEPYDHRNGDKSEDATYDPPAVYIFTVWGKMVAAPPDPVRDAILGFPVKWKSQGVGGWQFHTAGRLKMTSSGQLATINLGQLGDIPERSWFYFYKTPLGRRMLRHLTGGPGYIVWGDGGTLTKQVCMQGRVFTYPMITKKAFIDKEVLAVP
jgi:hypothetical protein